MNFKATKSQLAGALLGALLCVPAQAQDTLELTSAFSKNLPILGTAGVDFVDKINGISGEVQF